MSKIIGLVSWKVGENSFGSTLAYIEYLNRFGFVQLITPWVYDPNIDLLVLPGGPDINPSKYGEIPSLYTTKDCIYRDYFDTHLLPRYIEDGVPVFGICRGIQSLAVLYDGKLHQQIYNHESTDAEKRWEPAHLVNICDDLYRTTKLPVSYKVNSLHHQIIDEEYLSKDFKVIARYMKCPLGGVEAIASYTKLIAGVQWHPEEMAESDLLSEIIIKKFLEESQKPLEERKTLFGNKVSMGETEEVEEILNA